ncbi:MAG: hypothetical protein JNM93_04680 [Bacteriovoracaceae bacterium]|nr:hypothetical protein [Bacteriovoracaceae bacterium]
MKYVLLIYIIFAISFKSEACNEFFNKLSIKEFPDYVTESDKKFIQKIFENEDGIENERIISFKEDGSFDPPWCLEDDGPPYYDGDKFTISSENIYLAIREDSIVINEKGSAFRIWANLKNSSDDNLYLWFETKVIQTGARSKFLRGTEAYDFVIGHFNSKIKCVLGDWVFGDNLKTFNSKTSNLNISMEEAAISTWSGANASRYGFTEVIIEKVEGVRGAFSSVSVKFCRP